MIKKVVFSNIAVKFVGVKTSPQVTRLMGSNEQSAKSPGPGSGDSIKIGDSIQPVKMAYTSYESTKPSFTSADWPVIIMHGLLGSKANWNAMSKMLHSKTDRKIFAVDARNHGDSPHTPELTYYHLVEDLRALMNDLAIKRATFIGHSMGGRAVMLMGLRYPELVEKLIVVDISPITASASLSTMPKYFEAMKSVKLSENISLSKARKMADEQLAKYVSDAGTRQFFLTNLVEAEGGQYKWRINLDSITRNFNNIATFPPVGTSCPVPTLFVSGANSDYVRPKDEEEIKRMFTEAEFLYLPDCGHNIHLEKPAEFSESVGNYINIKTMRSRRKAFI
ncbi:sn-1-specific diacylglycerol lipase ABHD11-like isoform X1 [Periplaneta americana]|uniref:sn-1-specific diacylglycerol lipase ABHD11-like isoform X1 n=1 Tax=Periplaneta americana TaxID=6978 RepID=UPI0037E7A7FB